MRRKRVGFAPGSPHRRAIRAPLTRHPRAANASLTRQGRAGRAPPLRRRRDRVLGSGESVDPSTRVDQTKSNIGRVGQASVRRPHTALSKEASVYAFAISGVVQYVGVATGGLEGRLYGYIRPGRGQPTNIRINQFIRDKLTQGNEGQVFVASPEASSWNGLPVHSIAGLELGLIQAHHLPWNVKGTR